MNVDNELSLLRSAVIGTIYEPAFDQVVAEIGRLRANQPDPRRLQVAMSRDPQSRKAGERAMGKSGNKRWTVLETIFDHGPATDDEGRKLSGITSGSTYRPRRGELVEMGLIEASTELGLSDSGGEAKQWITTEAGAKVIYEHRSTR